jgi:hypothetical protein
VQFSNLTICIKVVVQAHVFDFHSCARFSAKKWIPKKIFDKMKSISRRQHVSLMQALDKVCELCFINFSFLHIMVVVGLFAQKKVRDICIISFDSGAGRGNTCCSNK